MDDQDSANTPLHVAQQSALKRAATLSWNVETHPPITIKLPSKVSKYFLPSPLGTSALNVQTSPPLSHFLHLLHPPSSHLTHRFKLQSLISLQDQDPTIFYSSKVGTSSFLLFFSDLGLLRAPPSPFVLMLYWLDMMDYGWFKMYDWVRIEDWMDWFKEIMSSRCC